MSVKLVLKAIFIELTVVYRLINSLELWCLLFTTQAISLSG